METVGCVLSKRLKHFIDARYDGNLHRASFHMDIRYSSLYRIYHASVGSVPFFLAYKVLRHTSPDQFLTILHELYPDEMRAVGDLQADSQNPAAEPQHNFEAIFKSSVHYSIYSQSLKPGGMTFEVVTSVFGSNGLTVAAELLEAKVLIANHGVLTGAISLGDRRHDERLAAEHAKRHAELLDGALPGTCIENPFGGLNSEGIQEMMELLDNTARRARDIFRSARYQGDSMYLTTILGGVLTYQKACVEDARLSASQ